MQNSSATVKTEPGFRGNWKPSPGPGAGCPPYLLLRELDLVQLLHVLLVVLLLQLADEDLLLLVVPRVLLGRVLLELHGRLRVQGCHYLLPGKEHMHPSDCRGLS